MQFRHFFMDFHLLSAGKFTTASRTDIHYCLHFHLTLPLLCELLSCPAFALLLIHLFGYNGLLLLFQLLLSFLLELLHGNRGAGFLFFDLSLPLTVVVVVLLLRPFLGFFLSLPSLIRQRFEVVIVWFVSRIHNSDSLPCNSKRRLIG